MKILVLNCGSSSVKYKLYDMSNESEITSGGVEKVGLPDSFLKFKKSDGEKVTIEHNMPTQKEAVQLILDTLVNPEYGFIKSYDEIGAVGHRMVHGGEKFSQSVVITDEVLKAVEDLIVLAPLHNPANIKGVEATTKLLPNAKQVAVFDTAFHQTMEPYAYMYALPYRMYRDLKVRRYGFHGTSHRYVSKRACEILGLDYNTAKLITCHIGNGGSIAAIKGGKVIDTSMGLTPTEGLMMGTRSGDVDPGALVFIMEQEGLDVKGLSKLVNKESGVAGFSEISSDMRDLENAIAEGNERAKLTLHMYEYRIKKYVGAYLAALNGADAIIFTGGVGENQASTREFVCTDMEYAGIEIDKELNNSVRGKEVVLSTDKSKVKVMIVPTDEELLIARDTLSLVQ
ncbi:acetate kinase [Porphyromonas levii]|uniref:Acetate kinase n=1 Tax=Porphyromonas levii TaxID=28114 RepID=A0A4Y8WN91_9PORP|nr:acetate kinase [Porphyromonas levii]MBR8702745.1 Acetate kinase [Porphyromonas levii]MBR8713012.1 Acetate kinase [Porphyromonas levii]MBR8715059.1 Acetate kinase [Porphyromonas levii]MBR8727577.1 Acetate kinase [Porphyromonas levii]MBR8730062.1 Acetate kinase [Porphyromonas levii]